MEVGYLTDGGNLVVVDSIGIRTLFTAYRIRGGSFQLLTQAIPLQPVGTVRVRVAFHRQGWRKGGETFVDATDATMFAAPGLHILIGPRWRTIRTRRRGDARQVHWPRGSGRKVIKKEKGIAPPSDHAPLVIFVEHASVRGCVRNGRTVEVFAVELREFSEFTMGKLTARVEFPDEGAAQAFAAGFRPIGEMETLDRETHVDIDRSKAFTWTRLAVGFVVVAVVLFAIVVAATAWAYSVGRMDHVQRGVSSIWTGAFLYAWLWRDIRWISSREFQELLRTYPKVAADRWIKGADDVPETFIEGMKSMGIRLTRDARGLAVLDRYLRQLPSDTYLRAFALDASGYAGDVMMRLVNSPVEWRWRWEAEHGDVVLAIPEVDYWASPATMVAKVWVNKDPTSLDGWIKEQAAYIRGKLPQEEPEDEGEEDLGGDEEEDE